MYPPHFQEVKKPIYKIGRTEQAITTKGTCKRLGNYPKGTTQLCSFWVEDSQRAEAILMTTLLACKDIRHAEEHGREYFEGSLKKIRHIMTEITDSLTTSLERQEPQVTVNEKHFKLLNESLNEVADKSNPNECKYCLKVFTRYTNCKSHVKFCKMRNDEVRCLELKAKVDIEQVSKSTCRFCHNDFSQVTHATRHMKICAAKEEYREHLKKLIKKETATIINNTTNNIKVNALGNENLSYLTSKCLETLWKDVKSDEEGFAKTVSLFYGNKDHPENHSIIYTNLKHNSALVKTGDNYEYQNINDILKHKVGTNLFHSIVSNAYFDDLDKDIILKYKVDEMNPKAINLSKIALYDAYKNGSIKKPKRRVC